MIRCGEPQIGPLEEEYVTRALRYGQVSRGPWCERFAAEFGGLIHAGVEPVSSGTAALHLALLACGVGPGDEVIVPATTYVATGNAVLMCGAVPVVVDVDPVTWTLSWDEVELALTDETKAVLAVHLYGVPAEDFQWVLDDHFRKTGREVLVVEDCAEAIGAARDGVPVGGRCAASAWSFYASKTITTGGEGGAVASRCPRRLERARHLATQGMTAIRYYHDTLAWNYRMTEMQAAFGCAQLSRLDEFLAARRRIFGWYDDRLGDRFKRQRCHDDDTHGCWAYAVLLPDDGGDAWDVAGRLLQRGIETRPVFRPLWAMPQFDAGPDAATTAEYIADRGLVLPTHCGLTESDVDAVCEGLIDAAASA